MGFIINVRINKTMAEIPMTRYAKVNPSLFKTKKKAKYIRAEPASGCKTIKKAGKKMMIKALIWFLIRPRLYFLSLISFATARAVSAFANSEGCKLAPPKLYHEVAPFIFFPNKNNPTKLNKEIT